MNRPWRRARKPPHGPLPEHDLDELADERVARRGRFRRAVLWNQLLDLCGDLAAVGACRPDLVRWMRDARQLLAHVADADHDGEALRQDRNGWNDSGVAHHFRGRAGNSDAGK